MLRLNEAASEQRRGVLMLHRQLSPEPSSEKVGSGQVDRLEFAAEINGTVVFTNCGHTDPPRPAVSVPFNK